MVHPLAHGGRRLLHRLEDPEGAGPLVGRAGVQLPRQHLWALPGVLA